MQRPESLEEYYARIVAATDAQGRLPVGVQEMPGWDIYPYEVDSLRMKPVRPPADAEPPRRGEDPADCWCASGAFPDNPGGRVWANERWCLDLLGDTGLPIMVSLRPLTHCDITTMPPEVAAEFGPMVAAVTRAVEDLPSVGRAQIAKYGDGGAHLHLFVLGRPLRMLQFRGSPLLDWEENLPRVPLAVLQANAAPVGAALAGQFGGVAGVFPV